MRRRIIVGFGVALAAGAASSGCVDAGRADSGRGRRIADAWCSECHRVAPERR